MPNRNRVPQRIRAVLSLNTPCHERHADDFAHVGRLNDFLASSRPYQRDAFDAGRNLANMWDRVNVISLPTGSGKTVVAAALAIDHLQQDPQARVLWLAPRWDILQQADSTFRRWFPIDDFSRVRVGGSRQNLNLPDDCDARVRFSTLPTWHSRQQNGRWVDPARGDQLIIIDESHWAQDASQGTAIRDAYLGHAKLLGLSATPRLTDDGRDGLIFQRSYADLCPRTGTGERYLAQPRVLTVPTGTVWDPLFARGVITPESLGRLSEYGDRNQLITATVTERVRDHNSRYVIVFCCNTHHADALCHQFQSQGLAAAAIHSRLNGLHNTAALDAFREGRLNVVTTVNMLAVGLDVPQIDTVVLARPTHSLTLLAQMIGRGSRLADGKDSFSIVEFEDQLRHASGRLFHAADYLDDAIVEHTTVRRGTRITHHERPTRHTAPVSGTRLDFVELDGLPKLPYVPGQTFGVELELRAPNIAASVSSSDWHDIATQLLTHIRSSAAYPVDTEPRQYHGYSDYTKWRVTPDSSCGVELISPILEGAAGFHEVQQVARSVAEFIRHNRQLKIDHHCGMHLTLATGLTAETELRAFRRRLARLEPGLYSLVAPSRLYGFDGLSYNRHRRNRYCKPVREFRHGSASLLNTQRILWPDRYHSVRLADEADDTTLMEVRMHHGTAQFRKILPWISLWMTILQEPCTRNRNKAVSDRVFAGGNQRIRPERADKEDIFRLLYDEGIALPAELADLIWERRCQLRSHWHVAVPKRVAGWERAGWYSPQLRPSELLLPLWRNSGPERAGNCGEPAEAA